MIAALASLVIALAGAVIAIRRPRNPIGWLALTPAVATAATFAAQVIRLSFLVETVPGVPLATWVAATFGQPVPLLALPLVLILLPSGRPRSVAWRPTALVVAAWAVALVAVTAISPVNILDPEEMGNPIAPAGRIGDALLGLQTAGWAVAPIMAGAGVASVASRYHAATGPERTVLASVLVAGAVALLLVAPVIAARAGAIGEPDVLLREGLLVLAALIVAVAMTRAALLRSPSVEGRLQPRSR